jgi:hypothetical protein
MCLIFYFQTSVGVKALFATTDSLEITDQFQQTLAASILVVRGTKPTASLRSYKVWTEEPYTTA